MNSIISIIFLLLVQNSVSAQTIVLVDLNNKILPIEYNYLVTITVDRKTTISLNANKSFVTIPEISCDSLIEVEIEGQFIKHYYNQYYCQQFKLLDTIQLSDRKMIRSQTPRLFLGNGFDNDSIFTDQLWLKDWLSEYDDAVNGISFLVNSSEKLTVKEERLVRKAINKYCHLIGKDEFKDLVVFKNECYTTGQEDLFNEGTIVTRSFIDNQNTIEMKGRAEKYSVVVSILIDWKKQ